MKGLDYNHIVSFVVQPEAKRVMSRDYDQDQGGDTMPAAAPSQPGTAQLLHIADYGSPHPAQIMSELRSYWEGLRQGRAIPARAEVEPRGIRRALDYTFILERIAPGAARFRLAGRHLVELLGMEVRGMPVCSFMNTNSRGRLSDVLECVFRGPQIAEIHMESTASYGRPRLEGRMLLLPLRSDLGDVTRVLGCLISKGQIGQGPRRFDLLEDLHHPVIAGAKVLEPTASAPGFSEPPRPWKPRNPQVRPEQPPKPATPEERRAWFHVVKGGTDLPPTRY